MKIAVSALRANPFRDIDRYPLDPEKVDALKRSIRDTTFWDNLLARPAPDGSGEFEMAYGHHRRQALIELKIEEIDIPVRDLTNEMMAQMMARENMDQDDGHKAIVDQNTVRSIIEAYGRGDLTLEPPKGNHGELRYAPTFSPRGEKVGDHPYTLDTLGKFLDWKQFKVDAALSALALIYDEKLVEPEIFKDLSTRQAGEVVRQTKRVLNEKKEADPKAAAATVARGLAAGMRPRVTGKGSRKKEGPAAVTIHTAKQAADRILGRDIRKAVGGKPAKAPDIDAFAYETAKAYGAIFHDRQTKMKEVIKYREYLSDDSHEVLIGSLQRMIKEAAKHLVALDPKALQQVLDELRIGRPSLQIVAG